MDEITCIMMYIANIGVPIYQIGKISAADMANFLISAIGIF